MITSQGQLNLCCTCICLFTAAAAILHSIASCCHSSLGLALRWSPCPFRISGAASMDDSPQGDSLGEERSREGFGSSQSWI